MAWKASYMASTILFIWANQSINQIRLMTSSRWVHGCPQGHSFPQLSHCFLHVRDYNPWLRCNSLPPTLFLQPRHTPQSSKHVLCPWTSVTFRARVTHAGRGGGLWNVPSALCTTLKQHGLLGLLLGSLWIYFSTRYPLRSTDVSCFFKGKRKWSHDGIN